MSRYIIFLLSGVFLLFTSCGYISDCSAGMAIDGRTVSFRGSEEDNPHTTIKNRLNALKNISLGLGWPDLWLPKGMLKETGGPLGYKIVYSKKNEKIKVQVLWSNKDKESFISTLKDKDNSFTVDVLYHCRPYLNKKSPLPGKATDWTDAQLGEWLCWEWAAKKLGTNTPEKLSAVSFVAWKFNEAVMMKLLGSGSLELAHWKETVRDRRTFQVLVSDLLSQVLTVWNANPGSVEREKTLQRIEKNWFISYRQEYKNRFLTNLYMDFGKAGWVDPLDLHVIDQDTLGWKEWESAVPQVISNAEEILAVVSGK